MGRGGTSPQPPTGRERRWSGREGGRKGGRERKTMDDGVGGMEGGWSEREGRRERERDDGRWSGKEAYE